ncbi:MAG TPA: hypothetical protein DEA08_15460 [Planctomycetes bacterium]|nr:hypothetical protein [Planctomycetota bacterium]
MSAAPTLLLAATLALASLAGGPAWAEEEERREPGLAIHLPGSSGLLGTGSMVDGELPSPLFGEPSPSLRGYSARFTLRYASDLRQRDLLGSRETRRLREVRHELTAFHGLTVHGLDLAFGLPYAWNLDRARVAGGSRLPGDDRDGVGRVVVAAKVGARIPNFVVGKWAIAGLSAYGIGRFPSSARARDELAELEAGLALIGPFGHALRYHGNLALKQRSGGHSSLVFRIGGSCLPLSGEDLSFRFYGHFAGEDHEGGAGLDLDFEIGGQLLLFGLVTVDVDLSLGVLDGRYLERPLRRRLEGFAPTRVDPGEAWTLTFGVGVVL